MGYLLTLDVPECTETCRHTTQQLRVCPQACLQCSWLHIVPRTNPTGSPHPALLTTPSPTSCPGLGLWFISAGCSLQPCIVVWLSSIPEWLLSPNSPPVNSLIQIVAQRPPSAVLKYSVGPSPGLPPCLPSAIEDLSVRDLSLVAHNPLKGNTCVTAQVV